MMPNSKSLTKSKLSYNDADLSLSNAYKLRSLKINSYLFTFQFGAVYKILPAFTTFLPNTLHVFTPERAINLRAYDADLGSQ